MATKDRPPVHRDNLSEWPEFLTVKEAAAYLRISIQTVYRLIKQGKLPAFRVASDWRIVKAHLPR